MAPTATLVNDQVSTVEEPYPPGTGPDSAEESGDWKSQLKNSVTTLDDLKRAINLSDEELHAFDTNHKLPLRITPYYLSLIDKDNPDQPIRKTMIPTVYENIITENEAVDPLKEDSQSPVPCLVHRYPDRVLFLATNTCAAYCRYCTRSRLIKKNYTNQWQAAFDYIRESPQVRDVLVSGGDPLTMSNDRIEFILSELRKIPHVEIIRIGTKVPVVLPQRITPKLVTMLKRFHPLWMNIHFTHPDELTPEVGRACERLSDAGIPLGSQTVLLKDINDNAETLRRLFKGLLKMRVRPYYLYQCDLVQGTSHFRTTVDKGREMIQSLRGYVSGLAVPQYCIDAPEGGGKIPLLPDYYQGREGKKIILKNYLGKRHEYTEE